MKNYNFIFIILIFLVVAAFLVIIYLDMPVEEAAKRGQFGEERYEKIDFQIKVREKFMALKASDEATGVVPWHTIDASQSIDEIKMIIQKIADETMERAKNSEIKKMFEEK